MGKSTLLVFVLIALAIPIANADMMMLGTHYINIHNQITNINDFPDYVFVSRWSFEMCPIRVIGSDGQIGGSSKYGADVYVIPKVKFNEMLKESGGMMLMGLPDCIIINKNETQIEEYFSSADVKKIMENIKISKVVTFASPTKEIDNYYTVKLDETKKLPDKTIEKRNYLFYIYISAPIIALIIIVGIIIKRKKE